MGELYTPSTPSGLVLPLQMWKEPITIAAGATTAEVEAPFEMGGVAVGAWIKPTTLTATAVVQVYDQDDDLTTPEYIVNYTVPNPAVETHEALYKEGVRVIGKPVCNVSGATAGDSFTLYVIVDPNSAGRAWVPTSPENLIANGTEADQALTVSSAVVQFAAFAASTRFVFLDCQDADVRFTLDGSDPTGSNGHVFQDGQSGIWEVSLAASAKFIRDGTTDAVVHASQLRVK